MGSGRKAKEDRRRRSVAPAPVLSDVKICQCPGFIGPHEEQESCRRVQRSFLEWMKGKMA